MMSKFLIIFLCVFSFAKIAIAENDACILTCDYSNGNSGVPVPEGWVKYEYPAKCSPKAVQSLIQICLKGKNSYRGYWHITTGSTTYNATCAVPPYEVVSNYVCSYTGNSQKPRIPKVSYSNFCPTEDAKWPSRLVECFGAE
jgi:hypothetical protein